MSYVKTPDGHEMPLEQMPDELLKLVPDARVKPWVRKLENQVLALYDAASIAGHAAGYSEARDDAITMLTDNLGN